MKIIRKLLSILFAVVLLLSFTACNSDLEMPKKELPPYPTFSNSSDGYSVSGKVTDLQGKGLKGASIKINDKVLGLTDDTGEYYITSLKGTNEVSVSFFNYIFKNSSTTINNSTANLNFSGSSNFTVTCNTKTPNGASLFGVSYYVNGGTATEDYLSGHAFKLNNTGRTEIVPEKNGFTFYPEKAVVYTDGPTVSFLAVPNENTMTVSGTLNYLTGDIGSDVSIYVNGLKYTKSVISETQSSKKITYTIYGLPYLPDGGNYSISAGSGMEGFKSNSTAFVSSDGTGVNFDLIKCKSIYVDLFFKSNQLPQGDYSYYVKIIDEFGTELEREKVTNRISSGPYLTWPGCSVVVEVIKGGFIANRDTVSTVFIDSKMDTFDIVCVW